MSFLRLVIAILLVFAATASASPIPFQGSSSIPEQGLPWEVDVRKSFQKTIRVKVFPHDLKNDWVHGKKDNPKTLTLSAKTFEIESNDFKSNNPLSGTGKIELENGKLIVQLEGGVTFETEELTVTSDSPVYLIRENNVDKSHSYVGTIKVMANGDKIMAVNTLPIETYLRGVVPKESIYTWPIEALKAQAVAARTYAYYHLLTSRRKHYDVDDTARFQVFAGISAAKDETDQAILETAGEVLTHNSKVIVAFFHSYSGGRADSAINIFGQRVDYCQGAPELFTRKELSDEMEERFRWIIDWTTDPLTKEQLMDKLKASSTTSSSFKKFNSSSDYVIEVSERNELFDSVKTLRFIQADQEALLNFINIRKVLGWSQFPAYHFLLVQNDKNEVEFNGSGWGHHVGLSQWGAFMMAKVLGKTYDEILNHYYHDILLSHL